MVSKHTKDRVIKLQQASADHYAFARVAMARGYKFVFQDHMIMAQDYAKRARFIMGVDV